MSGLVLQTVRADGPAASPSPRRPTSTTCSTAAGASVSPLYSYHLPQTTFALLLRPAFAVAAEGSCALTRLLWLAAVFFPNSHRAVHQFFLQNPAQIDGSFYIREDVRPHHPRLFLAPRLFFGAVSQSVMGDACTVLDQEARQAERLGGDVPRPCPRGGRVGSAGRGDGIHRRCRRRHPVRADNIGSGRTLLAQTSVG